MHFGDFVIDLSTDRLVAKLHILICVMSKLPKRFYTHRLSAVYILINGIIQLVPFHTNSKSFLQMRMFFSDTFDGMEI